MAILRWIGYLTLATLVVGAVLALVSITLTIWFVLRIVFFCGLVLVFVALLLKELFSRKSG